MMDSTKERLILTEKPARPRSKIQGKISSVRWLMLNGFLGAIRNPWGTSNSKRIAYFDLRENPFHRYLEILMHMLEIQGYTIVIRPRVGFLSSWASRSLFTGLRTVRTGRKPEGDGHLIFTDDPGQSNGSLLTAEYFAEGSNVLEGYQVPMPMGIQFYLYRWHDMQVDKSAARHRGILFFGNLDVKPYSREVIQTAFNCFPRAEVLGHIERVFPHRIERPKVRQEITVQGPRDIVLVDQRDCYIQPHKLRAVLSSFNFFLALSGIVMPLCHNLIEAMSTGCIPILQYPHLLSPALQDGINCLSYSTMDELDEILKRIPGMEEKEIRHIRDGVNEYYMNHLTPAKVVGELERHQHQSGTVRLNAEAGSTRLLLSRSGIATVSDFTSMEPPILVEQGDRK